MVRRIVLIAALVACVATAYAVDVLWLDLTRPIALEGGVWVNSDAAAPSPTAWTDEYTIAWCSYLNDEQPAGSITDDGPYTNAWVVNNQYLCYSPSWTSNNAYYMSNTIARCEFSGSTAVTEPAGDIVSNVSMMAWAMLDDLGSQQGLQGIRRKVGSTYLNVEFTHFRNSDTTYLAWVNGYLGSAYASLAGVDLSAFHLLGMTYDGLKIRTYIDGVLVATGTKSYICTNFTTLEAVAKGNYDGMGDWQAEVGPSWYWTRTIASNEVYTLYTNLLEGSEYAAFDSISTNECIAFLPMSTNELTMLGQNNGNYQMDPHPSYGTAPSTREIVSTNGVGDILYATRFSGANALVTTDERATADVARSWQGTNDSIGGLWWKADTLGANTGLFDLDLTPSKGVSLELVAGELKFRLDDAVADPVVIVCTNYTFVTNEWYYTAWRRDVGIKTSIYINGTEHPSNVVESLDVTTADNQPSYLGGYVYAIYWFDGLMTDFKIYPSSDATIISDNFKYCHPTNNIEVRRTYP